MSHKQNDLFFDEAHDLLEDFASHPAGLDRQLQAALDRDDLMEAERVMATMRGIQAQEHFHGFDIAGEFTDTY